VIGLLAGAAPKLVATSESVVLAWLSNLINPPLSAQPHWPDVEKTTTSPEKVGTVQTDVCAAAGLAAARANSADSATRVMIGRPR
jgi:hypothetical protein